MQHAARWSLVGAVVMLTPAVASAGLLDKLNEATKKMNEASQTAQQSSRRKAGKANTAAEARSRPPWGRPICMA